VRSLVLATDIDVLPIDRQIVERDGYLVVRSPGNPRHYFGNMLVFDTPPAEGCGPRWEALFEQEFSDVPEAEHRAFVWDRTDGEIGAAEQEFVARGYELDQVVGLIATPAQLQPHARENREVTIAALDPSGDCALWDQVCELQVAAREPIHEEAAYRAFRRQRLDELRQMNAAARGAWYVARAGDEVVASCGVIVTGGRGRFQAVDTVEAYRRRGICSRLVVAAGHDAAARFGAERLVIAAEAGYHALGLYESLGFQAIERGASVFRPPASIAGQD
jgi:ribosomal protein S18 acetylase RimI-like enzyme